MCGGHAILNNYEAEYFRQSQASLFWPITAAATAYKKALAGNFGHQVVTNHRGVNIAGTPHWGTSPQHNRAYTPQVKGHPRFSRSSTGQFTQPSPLSTYDTLGHTQRSTG